MPQVPPTISPKAKVDRPSGSLQPSLSMICAKSGPKNNKPNNIGMRCRIFFTINSSTSTWLPRILSGNLCVANVEAACQILSYHLDKPRCFADSAFCRRLESGMKIARTVAIGTIGCCSDSRSSYARQQDNPGLLVRLFLLVLGRCFGRIQCNALIADLANPVGPVSRWCNAPDYAGGRHCLAEQISLNLDATFQF